MRQKLMMIIVMTSLLFLLNSCFLFPPAFVGTWEITMGDTLHTYTFTETTFELIVSSDYLAGGGQRGSITYTATEMVLTPTTEAYPDENGDLVWNPQSEYGPVNASWEVNGDTLTLGLDSNKNGIFEVNEIAELTRS